MKISVKGMVGINLRQSRIPYLITGILFAAVLMAEVITNAILDVSGNETLSLGNYLVLLPLLVAILIPARNFGKLMNLGGKRLDFFQSCALTYLPVCLGVAFISVVLRLTLDSLMMISKQYRLVLNLLDVFGFTEHGIVIAFIQMTVFLLLFCVVLHTLTLVQGHWYGWIADAVIIAVICIFPAVAALHPVLLGFFNLIIFHDLAWVQILACLGLGTVIYAASLIPTKSKRI